MSKLTELLRGHSKRVTASRLNDALTELEHVDEQIAELAERKLDLEKKIALYKTQLGR